MFNAGYMLDRSDIGPSLLFITMPNVFGQAFGNMPVLAYTVSVLFYFLLMLAALTSTISMHEVVTAYVSEEFDMNRRKAATVVTIVINSFDHLQLYHNRLECKQKEIQTFLSLNAVFISISA